MEYGYKIICLNCGNDKCTIEPDYWDSYTTDGEEWSLMGHNVICPECGEIG